MGNEISDISDKEELLLVSQGIANLMSEDIEYRRKDILEILEQYPSLKKEKFSDSIFKQTIFDTYKKHFTTSVSNLRYKYRFIKEYCQQFPFLIEMTLNDKSIQDQFQALTIHGVESLGRSAEYGDDECNKYADDRMSSLFLCEDIYNSPFVSNDIKQSNLPGLKESLCYRYQSRHDGPRLKRVYDLAKKAGVSDYNIGQAIYYARSRSLSWEANYDPKLLKYKEFPKEELKIEKVKKDIRGCLECHISEGNMKKITSFMAAYPFLKEKLEVIVKNIKEDKKEEEKYDKETERIIHFVAEGMKKRLSWLNSERAEELNTYFADIVAVIPRAKIVEGVYGGMNAMNGFTNNKVKDKQDMLKRFPLTKEEINEFIKKYSMGYLDGLRGNLEYFPDQDFSDIFIDPEVKEKLFAWLTDAMFTSNYHIDHEKVDFLKSILNATQEDLEDRYITHFISNLKKDIENSNRSREIKRKLNRLRNLCTDKEKYKKNIDTQEVKTLLLTGAKMRICDHGFSDSFGTDQAIQDICNHEWFPLKPEDIEQKVTEIFFAYCKNGSVPQRRDYYVCIKKSIDEKNPELIEAGIQGLLKLLDTSRYNSNSDIDSKFININYFLHQLPLLRDELKNERIKAALMSLKKHFLMQGRVNKMDKFNELTKKLA